MEKIAIEDMTGAALTIEEDQRYGAGEIVVSIMEMGIGSCSWSPNLIQLRELIEALEKAEEEVKKNLTVKKDQL